MRKDKVQKKKKKKTIQVELMFSKVLVQGGSERSDGSDFPPSGLGRDDADDVQRADGRVAEPLSRKPHLKKKKC